MMKFRAKIKELFFTHKTRRKLYNIHSISVTTSFYSIAVAGQENERKNIKMLFVPADVMKALRKNLTTKDLPPGLPGQGTQRWTPVRLPGDKTHTFEIRINPRTAHKLNMNFQHFRVGRGHGLLLELKNVSLSTKGRTVLDRLVEFYKNCGSGRGHRIGMRPGVHMLHRLGHLHSTMHHSLLLPGDVPLLKRIQNALERFFPRRHDGSVDVFQHKDSSGAVHFLPFEEVRREVNNLIKRTLVKRDCVKISTNALTRALDAFRRQLNNDTAASSTQNESFNVSDEPDSENGDNNGDEGGNEGEEKDQVLSFSRNLDSFNPHPINKVNLTSSSAMNVPSDAAATKIVSALADLRKEINDLSSGFRQIPKDSDSAGISVGTDDDAASSNANIVKISSDNNEPKDGKNSGGYDISVVKNRRKKMSSDDNHEVGKKNNSNISNNDNNSNKNNDNKNNDNNNKSNNKINNSSNSDISNNKGIMLALKLKNIEEDLKTQLVNDFLKQTKNFSTITSDSASANIADEKLEDNSNVKISNVKPVHPVFNHVVNHLQRFKAAKEVKVNKNLLEHVIHSGGTKKGNKQVKFKGARNKNKHAPRLKDKKNKKRPSVVFHFKPKSIRLKLKYKGGRYAKADDEDEDEGYLKHIGKGRLIRFVHMRRRHPKIKEVLLPDEEEDPEGYRERKFDDSPVDASEDDDSMKVRLLRKLRWLRIHGHGAKIRRRKSPKLRVVVYDDDEEEKQPHHDNWHSSESDELAEKVEKIHDDDSEADSENEAESDSEPESVPEPSPHRSDPVFMDDDNTQQYNQGGTSNSSSDNDSDTDMQYLSDSIGDDSSHLGRSDSGADVPDLEPYLKKHYGKLSEFSEEYITSDLHCASVSKRVLVGSHSFCMKARFETEARSNSKMVCCTGEFAVFSDSVYANKVSSNVHVKQKLSCSL